MKTRNSFLSKGSKATAFLSLSFKSKGSNRACAIQISFRFPLESKNAMDSQAHPLPHGLSLSNRPCSDRFLRSIPFFSPAGMLMDFDCYAVQHQCCFVHQVLLYLGWRNPFPYTGFCPCGYIHFAMVRIVPANPAREFQYSANTRLRWASHGCLFLAALLAVSFRAETGTQFHSIPFHSIVFHLFHVVSWTLFYQLSVFHTILRF